MPEFLCLQSEKHEVYATPDTRRLKPDLPFPSKEKNQINN